jgi:hypothetical protein
VSVFSEPTLLQDQVETTLFNKWLQEKATLEEWTERFSIAASSQGALSEDVLKDSASLKEMGCNFKTPLKASQALTDDEIAEMVGLVETTELINGR